MKPMLLVAVALATALPHTLSAADWAVDSGPDRVALIELYTSEGCSSCPPAERWLNDFVSHPDLFETFIPVAFHVDYWDRLGWPDRFAAAAHTERQRGYAAEWKTRTIYTPGLVRNGEEWRNWRGGLRLPEADKTGRLTGSITAEGAISARFESQNQLGQARLHVAILGFDESSRVQRGENHGKTLQHQFVVLAHESHPMTRGGLSNQFEATAPLPTPSEKSDRQALVIWVDDGRSQIPLQAAGDWSKQVLTPGTAPNPHNHP